MALTCQHLISEGHRLDEIKGYTLRQVRAFMGAIERRNREVRVAEAIALRMAQAEGKHWKKYIQGLRGK